MRHFGMRIGTALWTLAGVLAAVGGVVLWLAARDTSPAAPADLAVCWRMTIGADGRPDFKPVNTGVRNLETCAANLEAVSLREGHPILTGAYQGQFVFITPQMIQSGAKLDGARYRLFDADTRAKIDRDLQWMLQDEKHPSQFGPPPAATP